MGAEAGQFRTVGEWTLKQLGVHDAQVDLPYLRRDAEQNLEAVLAAGKPALVFGHSMAGKTRITAEVIQRRYPDRPLWVPRAPDGMATLIVGGGMVDGAVVWLNDLDRYLAAPEHLQADWLDRLLARGNVVVATIRAKELTTLSTDVPGTAGQREVLERFARVAVLDDEQERTRHASEVTNPDQARGIARYGVAVYVGAGYRAVTRYLENLELHPLGTALVGAAADWRRMGLETIAESTLETLAPTYLPDRHRHDPKETFPDALEWASSDQSQVFRLLEPAGDRLWRAFDYILDYLSSSDIDGKKPQPIPLPSWQLAATIADPQQQAAVATRAHSAGVMDIALALYQRLATSADPEQAAVAMRNVGFVLKERKDWEGAEQAWRDTIATGHPQHTPTAMVALGNLLHKRGEVAGAEQAYRDAIATGHPEMAPGAMVFLGGLLEGRMDWEGAEQAYRDAIATGHPQHTPAAMFFLGGLPERMDWKRMDWEGAEQAYRDAIATGHPEAAPWAMVALGNLLHEGGDLAGAEQAYRDAIATGHPEAAARARGNLRNFRS